MNKSGSRSRLGLIPTVNMALHITAQIRMIMKERFHPKITQ